MSHEAEYRRSDKDRTGVESSSAVYNFKGKTVFITGAGGNLGRSIASFFSLGGASLILHVRRSDDSIVSFVENLKGDKLLVEGDLSLESDVIRMFKEAGKSFSPVDVLVNNAGLQHISPLKDISGDDWDKMMAVNLKAPHLCTRELVKNRGENEDSGVSIINIASIEAESPACGHSHYGASKAGLVQYSRASALELGPLGIRVNSVSPGLIYREGIDTQWPEGCDRYRAASPMGRLVTVEEVTSAVLFLASESSRGITGINMRVDRGVGATPGY